MTTTTLPAFALNAANATQGFMELPTGRVHYRLEGSGPVLVLCHGYGANLHMWAQQRQALGERFTLLSWDTPGFGLSDGLKGRHTVEDFARVLASLMEALDITEAHVAGLSMGGLTALAFAGLFPEKTRSLSLCDTFSSELPLAGKFLFGLYHLRGELGDDRFDWKGRLEHLDNHPDRARWGVPPEERGAHLITLSHHADSGATARAAQVVVNRPCHREVLKGWRKPLLLVIGTADVLYPYTLEMNTDNPNSHLVVMESVNHGTAVIHPHAFNRAMLDFLKEAEGGTFTPRRVYQPAGFPLPPLEDADDTLLQSHVRSTSVWGALPDVLNRLVWALFK